MSLSVTRHAVDRYVERVKPALGDEQARRELEALLELAVRCGRPSWWEGPRRSGDVYVLLAPGVVGAVKGLLLTTVVAEPVRQGGRRRAGRQRRRELHRWKESQSPLDWKRKAA